MSKTMIPMDQIHADHDFNCRGHLAPIDVADLAKDIREHGLLQPIILTKYSEPVEGKIYRLIGGFRRYMATKVNGESEIWASVVDQLDEFQARYMNLRENIQRKDLTIMQEAQSLKPLWLQGHSEEKIMSELGMARGWVQVRIMLLKLPQEVQEEVEAGTIKQTEIRELFTINKKLGKAKCLQATRDLKDIKLKGGNASQALKKAKKKIHGDAKRLRSKGEIIELQDRIREIMGNSILTRCIAWIGGEIGDNEFEFSLREHCEKEGITYIAPVE